MRDDQRVLRRLLGDGAQGGLRVHLRPAGDRVAEEYVPLLPERCSQVPAAVKPDVNTKAPLSALALFTNAKRSLINETVYKLVMVSAVDKKISQVREATAKELYAAVAKAIDQYGANAAITT